MSNQITPKALESMLKMNPESVLKLFNNDTPSFTI